MIGLVSGQRFIWKNHQLQRKGGPSGSITLVVWLTAPAPLSSATPQLPDNGIGIPLRAPAHHRPSPSQASITCGWHLGHIKAARLCPTGGAG
ncbi:unnamed protein product [Urochloa humidicola]